MSAVRPLLAAATASVLTTGVAVALPAMAQAGSPAATFSRPMILNGGGAEPSIRVPGDGKSVAYVSAPTGLGSNFWRITKKVNRDKSVTFLQSPVQQPDLGTGGGDSEISVGDVTPQTPQGSCAPIAYSGLHNIDLLDNFTVATSTDCGKSFALANPFATQNTLTDRQWQVFDGQKTNFLIYHLVSTGQISVSVSPDAGQHYVTYGASNANGVIDPQLLAASGSGGGSQQIGNIIVNHAEPIKGVKNPISGEPVHAMYAIFGIAEDGAGAVEATVPGATNYNYLSSLYVGKSIDGGVTWTDTKVFSVNPSTKRELNMLFPVISADSKGNLYAAWSDTFKIQYSVSTDHGAHWSKPYQVNVDNRGVNKDGSDRPDAGKADVFPWIAAGGNGLLDVVWYHGEGGAPKSNQVYRDPGDAKTRWTVAFAQLGNATKTNHGVPQPKVLTYTNAITPVIHYGDICQNGTFCSLVPVGGAPYSTGDRSLLDFFQIAVDKDGRANLAIADNGTAPGQSISAFTQQLTGYDILTGKKLKPLRVTYPKVSCDVTGLWTDPAGDATQYALSGQALLPNQSGLDLRAGWLTWDPKTQVATAHVKVTDLANSTPTGSTGQEFRFYFGWNNKGYGLQAEREATKGTVFKLISHASAGDAAIVSGLKGAFDDKTNTVTIQLPANAFAHSTDPAFKAPPLRSGAAVDLSGAQSRYDYPNAIAPVADEAQGVCPAKLVGGRTSAGVAGLPFGGFLPPAGAVHATVTRSTLEAAALAGLLAALVVSLSGRSRRRWVASVA